MENSIKKIFEVIKLGEKLKMELRHSWLSNGRRESVAEHTWRLSLMAVLIEPYLKQPLNPAKLLKMIVIHDLVEAEATDVPAFDTLQNQKIKQLKQEKEHAAIVHIKEMLDWELGSELEALWLEFEAKETYEARVANALDKLEAQIQHNEAGVETWLDIEREMAFMLGKHTDFDETLTVLKDLIEAEARSKLEVAGLLSGEK